MREHGGFVVGAREKDAKHAGAEDHAFFQVLGEQLVAQLETVVGAGKPAFPVRYAAVAGVHHLGVAVLPARQAEEITRRRAGRIIAEQLSAGGNDRGERFMRGVDEPVRLAGNEAAPHGELRPAVEQVGFNRRHKLNCGKGSFRGVRGSTPVHNGPHVRRRPIGVRGDEIAAARVVLNARFVWGCAGGQLDTEWMKRGQAARVDVHFAQALGGMARIEPCGEARQFETPMCVVSFVPHVDKSWSGERRGLGH